MFFSFASTRYKSSLVVSAATNKVGEWVVVGGVGEWGIVISVMTIDSAAVVQPWVGFGVSSGLWLRFGLSLTIVAEVSKSVVVVDVGVGVRSIAVGQWGVVVSVTVKAAVL